MEGPTRRGLSGIVIACALAAVVGSTLAGRAAPANSQENAQMGTFALLGGTQEAVAKGWASGTGTSRTIKVRQFQMDGTTPIMNYRINGPVAMHMNVISDDFSTLTTLQTYFNLQTGTQSGSFTGLPHHAYYMFVDSLPHGMDRQVFRFKSTAVPPVAPTAPISTTPTRVASAGPYVVTLERDTFPPNSNEILYLQVTRGGKLAEDLVPYVGASARAVFVNTGTLQYVYLHPMLRGSKINKTMSYTLGEEMNRLAENSHVGGNMQMAVPPLPAGVYKFWLEFAGGVSMDAHTAGPFTIVVQ